VVFPTWLSAGVCPTTVLLLVLLVLLSVRFRSQPACLGLPAPGSVRSPLPWHRLEQLSGAHAASAPSYWFVLGAVGWGCWGWLCLFPPCMGERADPGSLDVPGGFICPEGSRGRELGAGGRVLPQAGVWPSARRAQRGTG